MAQGREINLRPGSERCDQGCGGHTQSKTKTAGWVEPGIGLRCLSSIIPPEAALVKPSETLGLRNNRPSAGPYFFFPAAGLAAAAGLASAVSVFAEAFAGATALACFCDFAFWFALGDLSPMVSSCFLV